MTKLIEQIKSEEGLRLNVYICTGGKRTIGYGHNIDAYPLMPNSKHRMPLKITLEQAESILKCDVTRITRLLYNSWPQIRLLSPARHDACINMAFQLGVRGFMAFKDMRRALENEQWLLARDAAIESTWAKQTPARASRVAHQLYIGTYYTTGGST